MSTGYLSVKVDHVQPAWQAATAVDSMPSKLELGHARRVAVVHVHQEWPHGATCRNCRNYFSCAAAEWAYGLLKAMRWELVDLFDPLESVEASR